VPDVAIASDGPILSVAVFTAVPIARVRRMAVDTSSRTSVALARVLCARRWKIDPVFVPERPVLTEMLAHADAALVIGDPALAIDPVAHGVEKLDLGEAWRELTGLPFVYAAWAGRAGALGPEHVRALGVARDRGLAAVAAIARACAPHDEERAGAIRAYLRDNLRYTLGDRERAGLERFFALAVEVHHASHTAPLRFF
jgi:chorismate dehydratase